MKKITSLLMAAMLVIGISGCTTNTGAAASGGAAGFKEMTGETLDKIMEDNKEKEKYLVIDVRSPEEYNAGHVKFAVNMNVDELEANLSKIEDLKDKAVVTICNTGKKSAKAAELLVKNGFKDVSNAKGVKDFTYKTITKVKNVRGAEFQEIINAGTHTVIDSRDLKDFEAGHLKGAISILPDQIDAKMNEIPKDKPVASYCYSGNKAMVIAQKLVDAGYTDVVCALDGAKEFKYELVK